jgi:hypothetical protein
MIIDRDRLSWTSGRANYYQHVPLHRLNEQFSYNHNGLVKSQMGPETQKAPPPFGSGVETGLP